MAVIEHSRAQKASARKAVISSLDGFRREESSKYGSAADYPLSWFHNANKFSERQLQEGLYGVLKKDLDGEHRRQLRKIIGLSGVQEAGTIQVADITVRRGQKGLSVQVRPALRNVV